MNRFQKTTLALAIVALGLCTFATLTQKIPVKFFCEQTTSYENFSDLVSVQGETERWRTFIGQEDLDGYGLVHLINGERLVFGPDMSTPEEAAKMYGDSDTAGIYQNLEYGCSVKAVGRFADPW